MLQHLSKDAELLRHQRERIDIVGRLTMAIENHAEHEQAVYPNRSQGEQTRAEVADASFLGPRCLPQIVEHIVDDVLVFRVVHLGQQRKCSKGRWA
jgi:hypothetical protein